MTSTWTRVSAAMGIPFAVAYLLLLSLTSDTPQDSSSDQKILSYYGSHSHRVRDITAFFIAAAGAALFLWFLGHVRAVLNSAEGGNGRGAGVALASGAAFIAVWAVVGALSTAPDWTISDAGSKFTLEPNTFRLLFGTLLVAYTAAFVIGAPLAFAVGVIGWRTGVLPKWLAVVSFLGGIAALASFAFVPTWVYVLWILILSGYLAFRPWGQPATAAPPETQPGVAPTG